MKRKLFVGALLASCLLVGGTLVSCYSGDEEPTITDSVDEDPNQQVEEEISISLSVEDSTLYIEDTTTITATVTGLDTYEVEYEVTTGSEYVTVTDEGLVTAVAEGTARITGTVTDIDGTEYSDTVAIKVVALNEHIETMYSTLASFDYESGVYINGELSINLGTLNAGTIIEDYDLSVGIPLEATFGYTSSDDMIAKISVNFENITGLTLPITIDLSSMMGLPDGSYVTTVSADLGDYIKANFLNYVFTDLDSDELKDIEIINIYNTGTTEIYIEAVGGAAIGSTEETLGFYAFDLNNLFSTDTLTTTTAMLPQSKNLVSRGDVGDVLDVLLAVAEASETDTSYSLSVTDDILSVLNVYYSELGIGGSYHFEFDVGSEASSFLGSSSIEIEGLTIPTEFTEVTLTINNDGESENEDELVFNNIELSISGKTNSVSEYEFLNLTVGCPIQIEDDTIEIEKAYLQSLIGTYLA